MLVFIKIQLKIYVNLLNNLQIKYKENYEQDKAYVVFHYTITPEYETKAKATAHNVSFLSTVYFGTISSCNSL